jgi:(E)-4-hydroxy-3-methylbut-2-enyl-diphosphate synthase
MAAKIKVKIGNVYIGGGEKIAIQSMTNTKTSNIVETVAQIKSLEECGCEIVRATVNDQEAALAIEKIKEKINIPLVADIHFDYKLALLAIERGIDKIRINPGNIGEIENVEKIVKACKAKNIPIRIGVNGGSLPKDLVEKYGVTPNAMIEAGKRQVQILEKLDFYDVVLSFKISDVEKNIDVYTLANEIFPYPLHLGVTEAGGGISGIVKNSIGIGTLIRNHIGDTMRVSLTDSVETEIKTAKSILMATDKRKEWVEIISCPTCGRTDIDIMSLSREIEKNTKHINKHIKVAVMGCVVNGPGEAKDCDIGIAGGKGQAILFKKGEIIKTIKEDEILGILLKEIGDLAK